MMSPLGVILAGGRANRMGGGDKCLLPLMGRLVIDHVIERLVQQVPKIVINANGDLTRFNGFGLPSVPDSIVDFPGPLAGVLAGLDWASTQGATHIVTVAADTPFFPMDLRIKLEAAQDAQAMHGIDVEAEIMAALAQEITAEIDQEILLSLRTLAATEFTFNQAAVSGTATFVGDEHAALAVLINRTANLIAQRTRRGAGNYAVVSPAALTVLQSATTSAFARTTEGTFEAPTNTKFVGTLNGTMRIFCDSYANDATPVLVGYKGASETDAPAFYCPYVPLMSSGVVLDPSSFEPVVSFMTRYGYIELTNTGSSFGNAGDYLGEIAITNLSFS